MMRLGSVCSGIGGAELAFAGLAHSSFGAEIEPFPRAVLAHRFPDMPLHGDFTTIRADDYEPIDILAGGTPCQSFSIAGLRRGLADERGNLALEYLRLADRLRPRWILWENVPGVLSSGGGRDFGAFLGGLGELGYGFAYRVLDAQFFGLAQRRKRVFVVGCLGDWRRAAAVLFEPASLRGHPAPRREAWKNVARPIAAGSSRGGGYRNDADTAENLIAGTLDAAAGKSRGAGTPVSLLAFGGNNTAGPIDAAAAINAHGGPCGRLDFESETFVTHALRADGFDASEDGTGRGTPLVSVAFAFSSHAGAADGDQTNRSHAKGGPVGSGISAELAYSLRADRQQSIASSAVRRLTPLECERLQGFPDGHTAISYRGKPAADGPRYRALGNAFAVPVVRWIARRIYREHCATLAVSSAHASTAATPASASSAPTSAAISKPSRLYSSAHCLPGPARGKSVPLSGASIAGRSSMSRET